MQIEWYRHSEIDYKHWDNAIEKSHNRVISAFSWYLDVVSPEWEALIVDDYRMVMPLPVKKKWGVKYLVQPGYTQQLGVFSQSQITATELQEVLRSIPYRIYILSLNALNETPSAWQIYPNYILSLSVEYEALWSAFSTNNKRNVKKALKADLLLEENLSSDDFLAFYLSSENANIIDKEMVKRLATQCNATSHWEYYGVSKGGELIAVAGLLNDGKRLTYLLPYSSAQGKKYAAMFFLIDKVIRRYAESGMMLDFEGSKIAGIARFYRGFGAKKENYYVIAKNQMRWLRKILRKG